MMAYENPSITGGIIMNPNINISYSHSMYIFYIYIYMGVSKNNGTPKWMVYKGKSYIKIDDLGGFPLFLETPI